MAFKEDAIKTKTAIYNLDEAQIFNKETWSSSIFKNFLVIYLQSKFKISNTGTGKIL